MQKVAIVRESTTSDMQNPKDSNTSKGERTMTTQTTLTQHAVKMMLLAAVACALMSTGANAAQVGGIVSVDFDSSINPNSGGGGSMNPGDTAGVEPAANWTTVTSAGATSDLQDHNGNPTTLDINSITAPLGGSPFFAGQSNDKFTMSPDLKMMGDTVGINGSGGTRSILISLGQIPTDWVSYDLYVYVGTDVQQVRGGSISDGATTYFYKGSDQLNSYVRSTETGSFDAADPATYVLFEGLTGSSLDITAVAENEQVMVTGFQAVGYIPEPASAALLGLGLVALLRRR